MTQEYSRACLRVAVAQICQHLGWNSIHTTPMELLADVLERYLVQVGKVTHRYSEQFGRTDARLEDVFMAFTHMGVQVHELEDYVKHVDPLPFAKEIVSYPTPQENDLKFPNPDSTEVQQRKVFEYVPEYLPYMHPELNEEEPEDTNQSARPASPERLQVEPPVVELSPSPGDKRPVPSPGDGSVPPFKRQRLTTSQPLPEEASQSQYEMTSVVMTHSGILSPIREGKVPDSKAPPAGFKQIVIVRQKNAGQASTPGIHLPTDASVIKLDFNKDPNKGGHIVEVGNKEKDAGAFDFDLNDPEYKPKAKKKLKEFKRDKLSQKPFKIKRGPGRPRSPGRAAVVHTKGSIGFSKISAVSGTNPMATAGQEGPIDLSLKPTPPPPNISVVKTEDQGKEPELLKYLDYRPKVTALSKQQERDYEDTIDSVIGNKCSEPDFEKSVHKEPTVSKEKKSKAVDEWRVSHISESYIKEDEEESENKTEPSSRSESDGSFTSPPPTTIAPHLKFLIGSGTSVSPRPRGRPRGSGSGFYRSYAGRSPVSGRRGRPPLHRGSPGRPPLNRSPGRPPLNRSPGRPPLNRSPGRPSSGRSPGRPKGSGLSPRPRGRPRGSKSPRSRGASPRGGSPRAISHLKFDENNDSNDSSTHIFKLDNTDSEATLFEFPSRSPASKSPEKKVSPVPISRTPSAEDRSSSMPSPAPTEPAESSGSRDVSPGMSPGSVRSIPFGREPASDDNTHFPSSKESSPAKDLLMRDISKERSWEAEREIKQERDFDHKDKYDKEKSWERDYKDSSSERDYKEHIRDKEISGYKKEHKEKNRDNRDKEKDYKDYKERSKERDRELKEHHRDRDHKEHYREKEQREYSRDREYNKEREHKEHRDREKDRDYKEHNRDKDIKEKDHKEHYRDRDYKEHSMDRDYKEHSRERDRKEHSKEREHKEHSKDREHKEHSRDRESKEHSKDRDRDRSKEHRKDKKKKKKKNKDREKEKEDDKEKKEKHKEKKEKDREKEQREESPSVVPLQKLKIKFGGGSSSSPKSFSITTAKPEASPKPGSVSPVSRPEIPKLKFKMLPPKPDASAEGDQSWVSSIKKEKSATPKHESMITESPRASPGPGSRTVSPKPKYSTASGSDNSDDDDANEKGNKSGEEERTVSVVKGKVIVKKPGKRGKRKGSGKKGRPKGDGFKKEESGLLFGEHNEGLVAAIKRESEKEASPISPPFSPQNVPSPITIPALKAAPPPPSPPQPAKKISPPKPRSLLKEQKPMSPLVKESLTPKPLPVPVAKTVKVVKSPRKVSPKKSPKISPTSKKKGSMSPPKTSPIKSLPFTDFPTVRTPSPRCNSSPSPSLPSSPMYSPASSPARDSPLHFQIPPTPAAFPSRTHSPSPSPISRQISTDDEIESSSSSKQPMPPPELPPMPPTSAQKRAQRTVITETVGTFVNESGEKIWICPACTMQDDGSPMIGCDICDEWYHWVCVGIEKEPSEDSSWYCPKCMKPNKSKSKRGRKKKKV